MVHDMVIPPGGKVLVIDDEPSVSKRLAKWLSRMGYCYTFVDSVDDANELLEQTDFDIVLYGHEFHFYEGIVKHRVGQKA